MTEKVTMLVTAESIIAGFMIAYGALGGQLLFDWSRHGGSVTTTYIAGVVANAVILTSFASIILLFNSYIEGDVKYEAGYDLFLIAILGSAIFVFANSFSIHQFTVQWLLHNHATPISCFDNSTWHVFGQGVKLVDLLFYEFGFYAVFLFVVLLVLLVFPGIIPWLAQTGEIHWLRLARTRVVLKFADNEAVEWFARNHAMLFRHRFLIVLLIAATLAVVIVLLCVPSPISCIGM